MSVDCQFAYILQSKCGVGQPGAHVPHQSCYPHSCTYWEDFFTGQAKEASIKTRHLHVSCTITRTPTQPHAHMHIRLHLHTHTHMQSWVLLQLWTDFSDLAIEFLSHDCLSLRSYLLFGKTQDSTSWPYRAQTPVCVRLWKNLIHMAITASS